MDLILNTYGVALNRDNEGFVISNGDGRQRIPVTGIRSIQVHRGAQITSDAILLAIENGIEVIFNDKSGNPKGRVWSNSYGSISTIRKGQINFSFSHEAVDWIKSIIIKKIDNQQAMVVLLSSELPERKTAVERVVNRLEDYKRKIRQLEGEIVSDVASTLRGWEGLASKIYFEALNYVIPETFRFTQRSQHPALDPANALLNYGYGLLYSRIEGALIKAGIDPYVGVMHRDNYNRPVLVYDVIELYRIWVDYVVYNLLMQNVVSEEFFSRKEDGSCWLEALGRRILIQSFNDYLEEVVDVKGNSRSRGTQIQLYAQSLAQKFKSFE
ncbi:MAG: CRISPR-associated endonuclease Cas1 [Candidatus Cryptobacteroides sp.]